MLYRQPFFVVEIDTMYFPQRNNVPAVAVQGHFEHSAQ